MIERETLFISNVTVPAHRARGLNPEAVARLAESIKRLGLQTPISVRYDDTNGDVVLVAGLHRLEAMRLLGEETIPAVYTAGTADDARMWELAENLHRAELSPVERAEHIDEWRRLTVEKGAQDAHPSGGRQPKDRGHVKTADALGVTRDTVRRAEAIAGLDQDTRDLARVEGWSQKRLLEEASPSKPKPAPAIKNAFESEEDWRRALFTVWNRGAQDWRERALETLDMPVFDKTRAA